MSSPMHSLAGLTTSTGNCNECVISVLISLLRARYLTALHSQEPPSQLRCVTSLCATEPAFIFCFFLFLRRLALVLVSSRIVTEVRCTTFGLVGWEILVRQLCPTFLPHPAVAFPFFQVASDEREESVLFVLFVPIHYALLLINASTTIWREANRSTGVVLSEHWFCSSLFGVNDRNV